MFKDYDKYLSQSLKVYLFVLMVIFIMKLVGLDYFGLDINNPTLIKISNCISNSHLGDLYNFITMYLSTYFLISLSTNKRNLYIETFIITLIVFTAQCLLFLFYKIDWIYMVFSISVFIISPMVINKKIFFKESIKYILLMNLYQLISLFIRNIGLINNYGNFFIDSLLNIDQLLLFAITYNIKFMEGGNNLCGVVQEVYSFSQKKKHLLNLRRKLQKNLRNFKKLEKEQKLTYIIYFILSLFWNMFTLIVVLLVGKLNDTFIECLFIVTSFWLSKRTFGKAFHLSSMAQCFVVSNITYYTLNRITTPLGISIFIPIMLGVGLSYVTSKFVKKLYKPLYRGMPKEMFEETILKVVDKDSVKYKICYDYFINKQGALYLSGKYNYSEAGIRKIKDRINDKIKKL